MSKMYAIRTGISTMNGCNFILLQKLVPFVRKTKVHVDRIAMTIILRCVAEEQYSTWAWRQVSAAVMVSQTTATTTWDWNNLCGFAPRTFVARTILLTKNWQAQIISRCGVVHRFFESQRCLTKNETKYMQFNLEFMNIEAWEILTWALHEKLFSVVIWKFATLSSILYWSSSTLYRPEQVTCHCVGIYG
jgi:hypothetical protein